MKIDKRLLKIVNKMAEDSNTSISVGKYLEILKSLPRWQAIAAMSFYLKLVKSNVNKTTLKIESVIALSTDQIKQIKTSVEANQPVTVVKTEVKGSLLGGLRVKIGDMVFDDSVAQRINQLRSTING